MNLLSLFGACWQLFGGFLRLGTPLGFPSGSILGQSWIFDDFGGSLHGLPWEVSHPFWLHFRTFSHPFFDRFLETLPGGSLYHFGWQMAPKWKAFGSHFLSHFLEPSIFNF